MTHVLTTEVRRWPPLDDDNNNDSNSRNCNHNNNNNNNKNNNSINDHNNDPPQCGDSVRKILDLNSRLVDCEAEFGGASETCSWAEVAGGALKAPYYSGQTDDVEEAISLIFNYPGIGETAAKEFVYKESK